MVNPHTRSVNLKADGHSFSEVSYRLARQTKVTFLIFMTARGHFCQRVFNNRLRVPIHPADDGK